MTSPRKRCRLLPVLAGLALCPATSYGQTPALPNKPVRIIVPNAAGGPNDLKTAYKSSFQRFVSPKFIPAEVSCLMHQVFDLVQDMA